MTREEFLDQTLTNLKKLWNWMMNSHPDEVVKSLGKEWIKVTPYSLAKRWNTDAGHITNALKELAVEKRIDLNETNDRIYISLSPEPEPEKEQPVFQEDVISLKEITNDMYSDLSPGDKHDRWILNLNAEWYFGMVENDDGTKSVPGGQRHFKDFNEWKKVRYAHLPPNEVVIQIMQNKDVCPYKYSYGVFLTKYEWEKYLKTPTGMFKPTHNSVSDNLA